MKLEWSPLAMDRVGKIAEYIYLDSPSSAKKWSNEIFDSTEKLLDLPNIGRVVPELEDKKIREIIKGNYRIIYRIDTNIISILTVRHTRQILLIEEINS